MSSFQASSNSSLGGNFNSSPSPMIIKVLWRQQKALEDKHPDGVTILINEEDPLDIAALIRGPKDTPYEGGNFKVKIVIGESFPQTAPKGYFMTKIFHPNVSEKGEICVNTLKRDWNSKEWSLYNVLEVIKCLLIVPFPESSLNEEAGKIFMEDYERYFKIAKIYTSVHAMPSSTSESKCRDPGLLKDSPVQSVQESILNNNLPRNSNDYFYGSPTNEENDKGGYRTPTPINYFSSVNGNSSLAQNKNYNNCEGVSSSMDLNLLRHSRSVCVKPSFSNNNYSASANDLNYMKLNRKDSNVYTEYKALPKPNINSLPYINRSNSFAFQHSHSENLNYNLLASRGSGNSFNFGNLTNGNFSSGIGNIENMASVGNVNMENSNNNLNSNFFQPARTKKEEIKKWLSRI